jgi:hypothetical protein
MTDLTTRSDCPTDEILAAFVAGGLDDRARVVPFRLRRWRLAAIAALITFVIACGDLVSRRDAQDPVSPMPTLAAVAPPERLLEVRLSSLEWRPLAEVRRDAGIDLPLALRAEVERLRELAENEPTPENLHASAAAWLAAGNPAKAIVVIEQVPLQELSETALSDYAAALVAEGRRSGYPVLCTNTMEVLSRLEAPEARFNEALAWECAGRTERARERWAAYLESDETSHWAAEARSRLARLDAPE